MLEGISGLALAAGAAVSVFSTHLTPLIGIPLVLLATLLNFASWRLGRLEYIALSFAALTAVSSIWSRSDFLTNIVSTRTAGALILFIALRLAMNSRRAVRVVAGGYLVGCAVALYQLSRDPGVLGGTQLDVPNTYTVEGLNANYVAYALSAGAAALAIFLIGRRKAIRAIYPLSLMVLYWGIGLTGSRGGILGLVLAAFWWILPRRVRPRLRRALVVAAIVACIAISTGMVDSLLRVLFPAEHARETGNLNGRLVVWPMARGVFLDHPIVGTGAGSFPYFNPEHIYAHNAFLDIASGLGVVGLSLFLMLLASALRNGSNGAAQDEHSMTFGLIVLVVLPPICSGYWYLAPAFWVILALGSRLNLAMPEDSTPDSSAASRRVAGRSRPV